MTQYLGFTLKVSGVGRGVAADFLKLAVTHHCLGPTDAIQTLLKYVICAGDKVFVGPTTQSV